MTGTHDIFEIAITSSNFIILPTLFLIIVEIINMMKVLLL